MGTETTEDGSGGNHQAFDNPAFKDDGYPPPDYPGSGDQDVPAPALYKNGSAGGVNNIGKVSPRDVVATTDELSEVERKKQERRDQPPLKFIEFMVKHTGACFGVTLFLHVLMIILTAGLMGAGLDVLPIEFDRLPLEIRDDVDFLREVAWNERNADDNKIIERGQGEANSVQLERTILMEYMNLLIEEPDGNVFSPENLKAIKKVEDSFITIDEYKNNFCLMDGSSCAKPTSVIRFFDGTFSFLGLTQDFEFTDVPRYLNTIQSTPSLRRQLVIFLGKDAKISATEATSSITRVMIPIGGPLNGFDNVTHDEEAQEDKYKKFQFDHFKPLADDYYKNKVEGRMDLFYLSTTSFIVAILEQVTKDMVLAVGSFLFIAVFLMIQTRSLFISWLAVFSIITCFLGSNLIYRFIFDYRYLGIFHVLSLFIILGIGADDVFIFLDTWKDSKHHSYKSLAHRMSDVYRKASVAMLFTSLTTATAFFVSAASPFLAVYSFGIFSGIMIFFNYLSVILFFPTVVLMHHKYFEKYRCCCCCPREQGADDAEAHKPGQEKGRKSFMVRFLRGPYFKFVTHKVARWFILIFFLGVVATFTYFASTLKVNEDQIKFFKETTNVGKYLNRQSTAFDQQGNERLTRVYIVFGLKNQDLSECHKTDPKCFGNTVWDNNFSLESQQAQNDILTLCNDLKNLDSDTADELMIKRSITDGTTLEVRCFMEDMKDSVMAAGSPDFPYDSTDWDRIKTARPDIYSDTTFTSDFSQYFTLSMGYWINDEFNGTSQWRTKYDQLLGEKIDSANNKSTKITGPRGGTNTIFYGTKLKYAAIEVNTTILGTIRYDEGLKVRDKWEELINDKLSKMDSKDTLDGFQTTQGLWHWLKVQRKLVSSAIIGIGIGLAVALPILIVATHNVLVGILATFVLCCITVSVIGVIPIAGWKLGLLESLNLVLVVGLSVDYVVHLAEGYARSAHDDRLGRVRDSLEEVGISVLSGACTTLGAAFFMLFAIVLFFTEFGIFLFSTIGFSISYALGLFITLLGLFGPQGETGSLKPLYRKIAACCCRKQN